MKSILLLNFRQMVRSKFLIVLVLVSALIQFLGLKVTAFFTDYVKNAMLQGAVGGDLLLNQSAIVTLLLQCFTGGFFAFCYGIFVIPYLHTGERASLTYCQPINKLVFPLAYLIGLISAQIFLILISLTTFGILQGFSLFGSGYPWTIFLLSLLIELLAFSVIAMLGATLAIRIGKISAFLVVGAGWFILQLCEAIVRISLEHPQGAPQWAGALQKVLYAFPPLGKLMFHLFEIQNNQYGPIGIWAVWVFLLVGAFRLSLNAPLKASQN